MLLMSILYLYPIVIPKHIPSARPRWSGCMYYLISQYILPNIHPIYETITP